MKSHNWTKGDGVRVKPGITHPETESDLSGWKGRIGSVNDDEACTVTIQWESLTLKSIPSSLIRRCELQEISWSETALSAQDVEAAVIHDTEEERTATIAALTSWYSWWNWHPEQVKRIQQVVKRAEGHDLFAPDRAWHAYLEDHLAVPFLARIVEDLPGPALQDKEVKVTKVFFLDETHGTIVSTRQKRRVYHLPLYALKALDADAQTQQLIDDYALWFAHH